MFSKKESRPPPASGGTVRGTSSGGGSIGGINQEQHAELPNNPSKYSLLNNSEHPGIIFGRFDKRLMIPLTNEVKHGKSKQARVQHGILPPLARVNLV
jgi:hypothetical protein